jgi:hypothetical protein
MQDNSEKQMTCENGGNYSGQARHCELREQTLPSIGTLTVDSVRNGGASIKGWLRSDVLVRARIEASGENEAAAASMASQVSIDGSGGLLKAMGPEAKNDAWWSVSYEVFVPQNTNVKVTSRNGGVNISDVRGEIHFEVNNGGVHLKRVAGDVSGSTVNGGIDVDLTGPNWDGRQMEVSTRNGGVTLAMPSHYSAHIQAETAGGGIQSDFPIPPTEGNGRRRKVDYNLNSGGSLIHITTGNGSVRLKRSDTQ